MKATAKSKRVALYLLGILLISFLVTKTSVGAVLLSSPWWVYVVLAAIVLSGYLSLKYTLEDKRIESEWIEKEGEVYVRRMKIEREQKQTKTSNKVG